MKPRQILKKDLLYEKLYKILKEKYELEAEVADFIVYGIEGLKYKNEEGLKIFLKHFPEIVNRAIRFCWERMKELENKGKMEGYDGFISFSGRWLDYKFLKDDIKDIKKDRELYGELYSQLLKQRIEFEPEDSLIDNEEVEKIYSELLWIRNYELRRKNYTSHSR